MTKKQKAALVRFLKANELRSRLVESGRYTFTGNTDRHLAVGASSALDNEELRALAALRKAFGDK